MNFHSIARQDIYGLNTLEFYKAAHLLPERPEIIFLQALTEKYRCAGQIGGISLDEWGVAAPEDVFGSLDGPLSYYETRIGFNDGFFDLSSVVAYHPKSFGHFTANRDYNYGDCFFPRITPPFWNAARRMVLNYHGLVLYISPLDDSDIVDTQMKDLLMAPFPGEAKWLQAVTQLYAVVLQLGHDSIYFHAWAQKQECFTVLDRALIRAERSIKESSWFRENEARLKPVVNPYLATVELMKPVDR